MSNPLAKSFDVVGRPSDWSFSPKQKVWVKRYSDGCFSKVASVRKDDINVFEVYFAFPGKQPHTMVRKNKFTDAIAHADTMHEMEVNAS